MKHTQGPWLSEGMLVLQQIVTERTEYDQIANCNDGCEDNYEQNKANARLIASAPELLEALQECIGALKILQAPKESLLKYENIIAKATGE